MKFTGRQARCKAFRIIIKAARGEELEGFGKSKPQALSCLQRTFTPFMATTLPLNYPTLGLFSGLLRERWVGGCWACWVWYFVVVRQWFDKPQKVRCPRLPNLRCIYSAMMCAGREGCTIADCFAGRRAFQHVKVCCQDACNQNQAFASFRCTGGVTGDLALSGGCFPTAPRSCLVCWEDSEAIQRTAPQVLDMERVGPRFSSWSQTFLLTSISETSRSRKWATPTVTS